MARYIITDKEQDNLFITLKLSEQLIEGSLAHTIKIIVDSQMDTTFLDRKFKNDCTGRPAHNMRNLLKLVIFAYSNGIISSRKMERFAQENMIALALCENSIPDFTVIADFIRGLSDDIETLFVKVLLIADELSLLGNTCFALDGCKLPSNASRSQSGTFADLRKKQEKLRKKIHSIVEQHKVLDSQTTDEQPTIRRKQSMEKAVSTLQTHIDKIECFLNSHEPKLSGKKKAEISSNITDNESAKMKTSHGVIQGYNAQALVDDKHQLVVTCLPLSSGQDAHALPDILEKAQNTFSRLGKKDDFLCGKTLLADTGYFSGDNIEAAHRCGMDAYIPDNKFRSRDCRFEIKLRHSDRIQKKMKGSHFSYDQSTDTVLCPAGHSLPPAKGDIHLVNGFYYKVYHASKQQCQSCTIKDTCLKSPTSKWRNYNRCVGSTDERKHLQDMMDKIDSPQGRLIYAKRMAVVEPVFAHIRTHKRLDHFTLRGQKKVAVQWTLFCMVHNIAKISQFGGLQCAV